jgi:hypothetical protein
MAWIDAHASGSFVPSRGTTFLSTGRTTIVAATRRTALVAA